MRRAERRLGWQPALTSYLAAAARRPFCYGEWDCALFVAGAVLIVTGQDLRPGWPYATRAEGVRRMREDGHRDHIAWFRAHLPPVAPAAALPGDVAVMPGRALGIVQGRGVYVLAPDGLGLAPLASAREVLAV